MKRIWFSLLLPVIFSWNNTNAQNLAISGMEGRRIAPVSLSPLDAVRQRLTRQFAGQRRGVQSIFLDYATANGDDVAFASDMNMHYSLATGDSFSDRYVIVAYDSLHDAISDVGFKYSDFDSIRIDSLYILMGHKHTSSQTDTLIVKIVQLNVLGYPTNTTLWSQTLTAPPGTTFTGMTGGWLAFAARPFAPALTLPSSQRFGVRVEYYGAKQDTFGYAFSFVNKGACANYGLPYSAMRSDFWPNSYRYNVFNNLLLPTATGADIMWDCDGNGAGETDQPVQNINYLALVSGIRGSGTPTCDTLSNIGNIGINGLGVYPAPGGGYISGHNSFGDIGKADFFANNNPNMQVLGAFYAFGVAMFGNPNSSITAGVWDNTGSGGSPGNLIASETVLISAIANNISNGMPTYVQFNPPANISDDFYVGITFGYGPGDTVALLTDTIGSNTPTGWEQFGDGTWHSYYTDPLSWGIDIAHVILPIICPASTSCTTLTVTTTAVNSICTSSNGSATASASGGTAPYTYSWNTGGSGAAISGLAPGTYSVTAKDANNCTGTGSVTITATITNLNVTVTPSANTSCNPGTPNGSAISSVTGGTAPYSYIWSNGSASQNISGLAAGTYTVTVYDANGCSGTNSGTVGNNLPVVSISMSSTPNSQCMNPNGTATATPSGGGPFTYAWNDPNNQTTATATGLGGGVYSVTVTNTGNGCTGTASVTVTSTTPPFSFTEIANVPNSSCAAPNGTATVSASGGTAPYTYSWSPSGQTGATVSNVSGGTYTVLATDANGCTGSSTVTIGSTTPTITITAISTANSYCVNPNGTASASASGGSAPYTYSWSNGQTGAMITGLTAITFTVTATDANSCTGTQNVTVGDSRPAFIVNVSVTPVTSCVTANGTATASVTPALNVTYTWGTSPAQTGATATALAAGSYQVTATEATSGCTAQGLAIIGTNTPAVNVTISSSNNVTNCVTPNGSATAVASGGAGGFTYSWSNGQSGQTATGLNVGSYTVVATDANGCSGTSSVTISDNRVLPTVTVNVVSDVTSCSNPNGAVMASPSPAGQYTYSWSPGGGTSSLLNNLSAGIYTVTVTDNNGCTASGSNTVANNLNFPTVTATATNETSAPANDGTATAVASGGVLPYSYSWSNGGTTATITGLDADTYSVTVTDFAGCTASASATVNTDVGIGDLKDVVSFSLFPNPANDKVNLRLELNDVKEVSVVWYDVLGQTVMERTEARVKSFEEQFNAAVLPQGIYMVRIKIGNEELSSKLTVVR